MIEKRSSSSSYLFGALDCLWIDFHRLSTFLCRYLSSSRHSIALTIMIALTRADIHISTVAYSYYYQCIHWTKKKLNHNETFLSWITAPARYPASWNRSIFSIVIVVVVAGIGICNEIETPSIYKFRKNTNELKHANDQFEREKTVRVKETER